MTRKPTQASVEMRAKPDADGSLMFCWSKRGKVRKYNKASPEYAAWEGCSMCGKKPCTNCNGRSLSVSEWKTAFSTLSQKQKKAQLEANLNKLQRRRRISCRRRKRRQQTRRILRPSVLLLLPRARKWQHPSRNQNRLASRLERK